MSRLGNEDVTNTSLGILSKLTEAENLKVNKVVLTDGVNAEVKSLKEGADCEGCETPKEEGCGAKKEGEEVCPECGKNPCECEGIEEPKEEGCETPEGSDDPVPGEGKEPLAEEAPEEEPIEEKVCESLEILDIEGNKVLLKESKGYIVGKDYNKSTGIIKEAEEYRTEKVARKAFARLK